MENSIPNNLGMSPEDYEKIANQVAEIKKQESVPLALLFGLGAVIVSAILWAAITVAINAQIGFMAVGVGFLVGWSVRKGGKGVSEKFGILGAVLAILGCILGNALTIIWFGSRANGMSVFEGLANCDYGLLPSLMGETFQVMDLLFYGIAIYEGYRFSFKKLNEFELLEGAKTQEGAGGEQK